MENPIKELTYKAYQSRQQFEITERGLFARVQQLRSTDKFKWANGVWSKMPYKGYAIVSMLDANPGHVEISQKLVEIQQFLSHKVEDAQRHFFALSTASFHQTVANTLSSHRFKTYIEDQGLEPKYPQMIANAFAEIPLPQEKYPISMKLIGLSIFGSALGILGVFEKEEDFNRILGFRNHIYHNQTLNVFDIKRTRPFIGHITLMYIDGVLKDKQKMQLVEACVELNREIEEQPLVFSIHQTGLRYYEELSHFQMQSGFPIFSFVST